MIRKIPKGKKTGNREDQRGRGGDHSLASLAIIVCCDFVPERAYPSISSSIKSKQARSGGKRRGRAEHRNRIVRKRITPPGHGNERDEEQVGKPRDETRPPGETARSRPPWTWQVAQRGNREMARKRFGISLPGASAIYLSLIIRLVFSPFAQCLFCTECLVGMSLENDSCNVGWLGREGVIHGVIDLK